MEVVYCVSVMFTMYHSLKLKRSVLLKYTERKKERLQGIHQFCFGSVSTCFYLVIIGSVQ